MCRLTRRGKLYPRPAPASSELPLQRRNRRHLADLFHGENIIALLLLEREVSIKDHLAVPRRILIPSLVPESEDVGENGLNKRNG